MEYSFIKDLNSRMEQQYLINIKLGRAALKKCIRKQIVTHQMSYQVKPIYQSYYPRCYMQDLGNPFCAWCRNRLILYLLSINKSLKFIEFVKQQILTCFYQTNSIIRTSKFIIFDTIITENPCSPPKVQQLLLEY